MKLLIQLICLLLLNNIATAQNVGVGNTAPAAKLHVRSGISGAAQTTATTPVGIFENSDNTYLELFSPSNRRGGINFSASNSFGKIEFNHAGQYMTFFINDFFPIMSLYNDKVFFGDAGIENSAIVNINRTDKGLLIPRMTSIQRNAIATPATGLTVYDSDSASYMLKTPSGWTKFLLSNTDMPWKKFGNNIFNTNSAFVGINTITPLAMLHVKDSNVLFSGAVSLPPLEPGLPPANGVGTRMMWYPDKAAFRAGRASASEWDAANTGLYSLAGGLGNKASGTYSTAFGQNNSASNTATTALGNGSVASAIVSTSIGNNNLASGNISIALGNSTTASGAISTAMGENTFATGTYTTTMGKGTIAQAYGSLSIGQFNDSIVTSSPISFVTSDPIFIIGNGTSINSRKNALTILKNGKMGINTSAPLAMLHVKDSSVAFTGPFSLPLVAGAPPVSGSGTRMMWYSDKAAFRAGIVASGWDKNAVGLYSFASGNNPTAFGETSVAFGEDTYAGGNYSVAMGFHTEATGNVATAMGNFVLASGDNSTALGSSTHASGLNSIAMGSNTTASGNASTSIGSNNSSTAFASTSMGMGTLAIARSAVAMGEGSKATGEISAAMGFNTTARAYGSLALGQYNDSIVTSSTTSWVVTDPVFIIGNGTTASNRTNAITVLKNAKTGINTASPQAALHIKGISPSTFDSHIRLETVGGTDYVNIVYDGNMKFKTFGIDDSYQWRTFDNNTRMTLDQTGNLFIDGIITQSSDARLKTNMVPLANCLQKISQLNGYHYNWTKEAQRDSTTQIGMLAQNVENEFPEVVHTDAEGFKSVAYQNLIPVMIEAIKELKKENEAMKKELQELKTSVQK